MHVFSYEIKQKILLRRLEVCYNVKYNFINSEKTVQLPLLIFYKSDGLID